METPPVSGDKKITKQILEAFCWLLLPDDQGGFLMYGVIAEERKKPQTQLTLSMNLKEVTRILGQSKDIYISMNDTLSWHQIL